MTAHPHDSLIKANLSDPQEMQGMLKAILPAKIIEQIHWPSLRAEPTTFIDPELRDHYTDLLFSSHFKTGQKAFIYFLIEHVSTSKPFLLCTLHRYIGCIWDDWIKNHKDAKKIPVIIPVVEYHDKQTWVGPTSLHEIVDFSPETKDVCAEFVPSFRFLLDDLRQLSNLEVRNRHISARGKLTIIFLRDARHHSDFLQVLRDCADLLMDVEASPHGKEDLKQLLMYILKVRDDISIQQLIQFLQQYHIGKKPEEAVMTVAEQLQKEAREDTRRQVLLDLLHTKFSSLPAQTEKLIEKSSSDKIKNWTTRILTATTLRDIFGEDLINFTQDNE